MAEVSGGFGMPCVEIDMVSTATAGALYKSTGGTTLTYVGSSVEGLLSREQVGSGSRSLFVCRSDATPARLVFYSGSGPLGKSSGTVGIDLQAVRTWKDRQGEEQLALLDFSGASVRLLDSLESDATVCAAEVAAPSVTNMLVSQPESLVLPLAVRLVKQGASVRSYGESAWQTLTTISLPAFSPGDVVCFESLGGVSEKRGYTVVQLCLAGELAKGGAVGEEEKVARGDALEEASTGNLVAYPNPFNPTTSLRFHLRSPGRVQLAIYDLLGRVVATVADGSLEAGYHSLLWNASGTSSGVYYARLSVQREIPGTDATTVRRLLLMK
jgi:hypothetical protein